MVASDRRHVRHVLHQLRIPRGGQAQRHRVDGAVTVDHVGAEQDRDAQAAVHRRLLEAAGLLGADHVEHRAQLALLGQVVGVHMVAGLRVHRDRGARIGRGGCRRALVVVLHQLADLLGQGHLLQQRIDLMLDLPARPAGRWRAARRRGHGRAGDGDVRRQQRPAPRPRSSAQAATGRNSGVRRREGGWTDSFSLLGGASGERAGGDSGECKRLRRVR